MLETTYGRRAPECVTLDVAHGATPSGKPPVRIFLGTEGAQYRAERVFVWSIERVRDPSRVYQIYLMKELEGFDRRGWTTGFTNYRFAIPSFAGATGKAIWNDEDQIYLSDPAALFDAEIADCGVLALGGAERIDTAVMLIDCEKMAAVWSLDASRHASKKSLIARALAIPGLVGELSPDWHTRDADEFCSATKLLHYTTLHTQPWRPSPERFVYQDHPLAQLWHDLERSADEAGFHLFTRDHPSERFRTQTAGRDLGDRAIPPAEVAAANEIDAAAIERLVADGAGPTLHRYSPYRLPPATPSAGVVCQRGLERLPEDDVPWVLEEMFRSATQFIYAVVRIAPPEPERPGSASLLTDPSRWPDHFARASARRPEIHWELVLRREDRSDDVRCGGRRLAAGPPTVWIAARDRREHAETRAAVGLAAELGWRCRQIVPGRCALAPPWPDVVISSGRSGARTARFIREVSRGRTRTVHLGPEARPDEFDLVVTPVSADLFPHPRRLETALPLSWLDRQRRGASAEAAWRKSFDEAAKPRIAFVLGRSESGRRLDAATARRIAGEIRSAARAAGGSVFALVDDRLAADAATELERSLGPVESFHSAQLDRGEDAYLAHLALADAIIALADDERTLADACATGKPVALVPVEGVASGWSRFSERLRAAVVDLARAPRANRRGTVRPQQGLERLCSQLVSRGLIYPPQNLERMREVLVNRCCVQPVAEMELVATEPLREIECVAARVREIVGVE